MIGLLNNEQECTSMTVNDVSGMNDEMQGRDDIFNKTPFICIPFSILYRNLNNVK